MKTEGEYLNPEQNKKTNSFEGRLRTSIRTATEQDSCTRTDKKNLYYL